MMATGSVADFDILHSRIADERAIALAFDLLLSGDDIRRQPLIERKNALRWDCAKRARASNTSRILMAKVRKCSLPSASSASKGL